MGGGKGGGGDDGGSVSKKGGGGVVSGGSGGLNVPYKAATSIPIPVRRITNTHIIWAMYVPLKVRSALTLSLPLSRASGRRSFSSSLSLRKVEKVQRWGLRLFSVCNDSEVHITLL